MELNDKYYDEENIKFCSFKKSDDNFMALKIVFDATKRLVYSKR